MNLSCIIIGVSALAFVGCVPVPFRDTRTYAVTGRVIDADSRAALPNARVEFLDYERRPLTRPKGSTDGSGYFDLPRSYNYHAFAFFFHDIVGWPIGTGGCFLLVSLAGYGPLTLDLEAASHDRGKIVLGDIALTR